MSCTILFVGVILLFTPLNILGQESFSLVDFLEGKYRDRPWSGTWYSDTKILELDGEGNYRLHDATTPKGEGEILLKQETLEPYKPYKPSITFSHNNDYVLIKYDAKPVYRHTTLAKYAVLKVDGETVVELHASIKDQFLQFCRFSPAENALIIVQENNILYVKDLVSAPKPITLDGEPEVFNGIPDWIYEEEVFSRDSALWPSPLSNKFVYAQFDDSDVPLFTYPLYGNSSTQYPEYKSIHYPKAGQNNPKFSLLVANPDNPDADRKLKLETITPSNDYVLYDVAWRGDSNVVVSVTNREQNERYLLDCTVNNGVCTEINKRSEPNGWLDVQRLTSLPSGDGNVNHRVVEVIANVKDGFDAFLGINSDGTYKTFEFGGLQLTVKRIIGIKEFSQIYFEAVDATQHAQQQIYVIKLDSAGQPLTCITCEEEFMVRGAACQYARGVLSKDGTYLTRVCSGPGPTYVDVLKLEEGSKPTEWQNNEDLETLLRNKRMPEIKDFSISIPDTKRNGTRAEMDAKVRLLLPPGFSASNKYPMLVNVYGGPNSNQISDAYTIGLQHYLVTSKGYIYAFIDARGSGNRGRDLIHEVYKKLGTVEINDQIAVTKTLVEKNSYIDAERVCIWGWSYGGFATAHIMARADASLFKCGVSVAPVTNFIFYDSIYTERYMGVYYPEIEESKDIYAQTDVTLMAEKFKGKNFLLVHGNADDNVHYQQAMQLARALEKADIPFEQMSYPDEAHGLVGVSKHLYHMLDAYWDKHLTLAKKDDNNSANASQQLNVLCAGEYKKICCRVFGKCNS